MNKKTVLFTDSGLGGLTIMADFVERVKKETLPFDLDIVFYNAQKSQSEGYKVMTPEEQVETFEKVLVSMKERYNPDLLAIACNSLSVVYFKTPTYKNGDLNVLDIVEVGKDLLSKEFEVPVIEIAMPTTVKSKLYSSDKRNMVSVASDIMLPNAIENHPDSDVTDNMLTEIFEKAASKMTDNSINHKEVKLFLGCTHFPIIKDKFVVNAKKFNFQIDEIINPNAVLCEDVLKQIRSWGGELKNMNNRKPDIIVKVISRTRFRDNEVINIAKLLDGFSPQTAAALRGYELIPDLF
ncbi:MAG: hypothetical protein ABFS32_09695 [Bacteroidota bacterium]